MWHLPTSYQRELGSINTYGTLLGSTGKNSPFYHLLLTVSQVEAHTRGLIGCTKSLNLHISNFLKQNFVSFNFSFSRIILDKIVYSVKFLPKNEKK